MRTMRAKLTEQPEGSPIPVFENPLDGLVLGDPKPNLAMGSRWTSRSRVGFEVIRWGARSQDDPFRITLSEFLSLDLEDVERLYAIVATLCKRQLTEAWRSGAKKAVISDGTIVHTSPSEEGAPVDLVKALSQKLGRPCYVFSAPDAVEECVWNEVNDHDCYPTIDIFVGTESQPEADIIKAPAIPSDFDTGNPNYRIFDASLFPKELTSFNAYELNGGVHLGMNYAYYERKVKVCVKDISGSTHSLVRRVRLVKNWKGGALLQASPNRRGYVGRDLVRDLRVKVELDPARKTTRILGAD